VGTVSLTAFRATNRATTAINRGRSAGLIGSGGGGGWGPCGGRRSGGEDHPGCGDDGLKDAGEPECGRNADVEYEQCPDRLLAELVARQLLQRDNNGRFRAGLPLRQISARTEGETAMIEDCAAPVLHDLAGATGFRIRLGVLAWQNVTYIEKRPDSATMTAFTPDATLPAATSALGRVVLAYAPPTAVDALHGVSRVDRSAPPINDLRRSLAVVRSRQMAINPGGGQNGHCCFAKPVFGPGGHVVAALGMTVTDLDAALRPLIGILTITARSLSRELSGSRRRSVHFSMAGDASLGDSPGTLRASARHMISDHNEIRSAPVKLTS
jgi:DNA-binding IclR family transcriptional regulator